MLHFDEGRPLYFGIGSLRDVQVAPSCSFKMPVDRADRGDPEPRQPSEQKASSLLLPPTCECAYMVMRIQSAYIRGVQGLQLYTFIADFWVGSDCMRTA